MFQAVKTHGSGDPIAGVMCREPHVMWGCTAGVEVLMDKEGQIWLDRWGSLTSNA